MFGYQERYAVSIHAPARGATSIVVVNDLTDSFNSRARKGRDALKQVGLDFEVEFQFTRPQGARHTSHVGVTNVVICFNSRARKGRDLFFADVQVD